MHFKIIVCLNAFIIGILIYSATKGGYSVSIASFVNTITMPFRTFSNAIAVKIETGLDKMYSADEYYQENMRLREQIGELNEKLRDYDAIAAELSDLRKFIGIKDRNPDFVLSEPCAVISYTANDPFKSFVINRGKNDGIEPLAPVVTGEGLVGIVAEVSAESAVVKTLLSPEIRFAAVSYANEVLGVVEGNTEQALKNETRLIHISEDAFLKPGDMLYTTNSSGLFPKGYVIGSVNYKSLDESGVTYYAAIEPAARIERLTSVIVIKDFSGKDVSYAD